MADCGCSPVTPETAEQRKTLKLALALNGVMFVVETTSGIIGNSTGLIADGLDMLAMLPPTPSRFWPSAGAGCSRRTRPWPAASSF